MLVLYGMYNSIKFGSVEDKSTTTYINIYIWYILKLDSVGWKRYEYNTPMQYNTSLSDQGMKLYLETLLEKLYCQSNFECPEGDWWSTAVWEHSHHCYTYIYIDLIDLGLMYVTYRISSMFIIFLCSYNFDYIPIEDYMNTWTLISQQLVRKKWFDMDVEKLPALNMLTF